MRLWLNEAKGVLAKCEQVEPVTQNGRMIRGKRNGEFVQSSKGPDILHQTVSGQVELDETDPRVQAFRTQQAGSDTPRK